jgi:mono/diheme cytochrome c family protein
MGRLALIAAAAIALALGLAACGNETTRSTAPESVSGQPPAESGATGETGGAETGGGGEATEGDPAAGKEVFASAGCGSCHTLADAGTSGTVGPNLDDTKPPYDLVVERVTNGKPPMPAFGADGTLTEEQIQDVAAYVVQATSG